MSSMHAIAPDDVVATLAHAEGNERAPLVVLDTLTAFLDEHGLGDGELEIEPVGDGHSNVTYAIARGDAHFVLRRPPRPPLPFPSGPPRPPRRCRPARTTSCARRACCARPPGRRACPPCSRCATTT